MAYGRVDESFWHDDKIRALSRDARDMLLYLLTCPHRNRLGCFVLDPFYATADLQWKRVEVEEALRELAKAGRIGFDAHNRVVFICNYIKHNLLENQNVVKAAVRDLRSLPDTPLLGLLAKAIHNHARPHFEEIEEAIGLRIEKLGDDIPGDLLAEGFGNGYANHSHNGSPNRGLGYGKGSSSKKTKDAPPISELWDIWVEEVWGGETDRRLTSKRQKKLEMVWKEHLKGRDDPQEFFRQMVRAMLADDWWGPKESTHLPEKAMKNAERREEWAIAAKNGKTTPKSSGVEYARL